MSSERDDCFLRGCGRKWYTEVRAVAIVAWQRSRGPAIQHEGKQECLLRPALSSDRPLSISARSPMLRLNQSFGLWPFTQIRRWCFCMALVAGRHLMNGHRCIPPLRRTIECWHPICPVGVNLIILNETIRWKIMRPRSRSFCKRWPRREPW